jgi:glucokinase
MQNTATDEASWLIADIGATNARCAIYNAADSKTAHLAVFTNREFESLQHLLERYLAALNVRPCHAVLAVAAPIIGDTVQMINCDWHFERRSLADSLGLQQLRLVNDYHAVACALPFFESGHLAEVGRATAYADGNRAVLGPGSGLGMAAWIGDVNDGRVMTGEGGHISLPARNDTEESIVRKIRGRYGHCSAERVLSGPGIVDLHEAMHGERKATSEEITRDTADASCVSTMDQFFTFLASVAADLALVSGAFGGLYIGGGIVPACLDQIERSPFRERFCDKYRYRDYMRSIPTYVVTDPTPGLTGLAALIQRKLAVD